MPIVKMDEKGRIQLPRETRDDWELRPKQPLLMEVRGNRILLSKAKAPEPSKDPLLRDIFVRPGRSKVRATKKLLRKFEDEAWAT